MSPEDVQVMLQAAAINALYSGHFPRCQCGLGATWESNYDVVCDTCPHFDASATPIRCAAVVRKLNALAGL